MKDTRIDKVSHIQVTINRSDCREQPESEFSMVLKPLYQGAIAEEHATDYFADWNNFTKAGVHTVPLMKIYDEHTILMSDMTADGSVFYGKNMVYACFERFKNGKITDMDRKFLNIDPNDILKEAQRNVEAANKAHLFLPYDDPFDVLVHPDGTWEVVTIDLTRSTSCPYILRNNRQCLDKLNMYITWMRQGLTGTGSPPDIVT